VPIATPWLVSYLSSFESNIVSLIIFEIFDVKRIFSIRALVTRKPCATADTLRDLGFWLFDLGKWSCMACHMVNRSIKFQALRLPVLEL